MPSVTQRLVCRGVALSQVLGRLAEKPPLAGRPLAGLLVRARGRDSLLAPADLPAYTKLHPGRILQRQALPLCRPFSEARLLHSGIFSGGLRPAALPSSTGWHAWRVQLCAPAAGPTTSLPSMLRRISPDPNSGI